MIREEKRSVPFKDDRPGYEWYYAFLARNPHLVDTMSETPLEISRAKLTTPQMDNWYRGFRDFLSSLNLLNSPRYKATKVIGPLTATSVPHVTGGSSKERLTAMFCANAEGKIMPPFLFIRDPDHRAVIPP